MPNPSGKLFRESAADGESGDRPTLEGNYIKVLSSKTGRDAPSRDEGFSGADLDEMARNYPPPDGKKAVLGVERHWPGAQPHGEVESLRRDRDGLWAKLVNVDPRLDQLYRHGAFKKTFVTGEYTPQGLALRRVGFGVNGSHALIEQLHQKHFRQKEADGDAFSECDSVRRLKKEGRWASFFDEAGVPAFCRLLEGTSGQIQFGEGPDAGEKSLADAWVEFLEHIFPLVDGFDLDRESRKLMKSCGISYSEAMRRVGANRAEMARDAQFSEQRGHGMSGIELDRESRRLSRERGISYGDALNIVAAERPELTRR